MTPGLWHRAQRWLAIAIVLMTSLWIPPVVAQTYPSKPIRMIVPFAPGGGTDNLARILSKKMSETFEQSVVVDNRGGAGGIVGTELVARAAADGHTILMTSSAHTIIPATYGKIPYEPLKDFAPISLLTAQPYLMVIHPSVPANSVKEFIALAKSRPGQLNYASGGYGTAPHLAAELLKSLAGIDLVHVPYKGGGPAVTAIVSGEVSVLFSSLPTTLPQVQAGRLKMLAISSAKRSAVLPQLPTLAESGVSGFEVINWYGLLAPAKTPRGIIDKLHDTAVSVLLAPDMSARLTSDGTDAVGGTPEQFRDYIAMELAKWGKLGRTVGLKSDSQKSP
ncbi:MAG TPA: tripartite tricarboxylate transporter substrate binding protein [Burkholderiales bacterium]|nr:tripartite tricarboxylate transporter substrate binding protein [Burkholderiales bacterium]